MMRFTKTNPIDGAANQRQFCTLLQVECLSVKGPRYWSKRLDSSGRDNGLEAVYRTQMLFVQRKAGALSYADDPSGDVQKNDIASECYKCLYQVVC